jgi:hypothetical protein
MSYIVSNLPAINKVFPFSVSDFSGGMNNKSNLTGTNQISNMLNMTFYDSKVLDKRKGSVLFDSNVHSEPITYVGEFQPYTEANQLVRAGKTSLTFLENGVLKSEVIGGNNVDAENFFGRFFFVDGVSIRVRGKFPQSSDTYTRIVGTANTNYCTLKVVSCPMSYTPLSTSYTKGVTVYDYTNMQVWYEPCQKEKDDPYLGANVVPDNAQFITSFKGRLYVSGNQKDDDNVFITNAGNPYYYAVSLPIQLPPNSDEVTSLSVYDDSVIVGRKHDIHVIDGLTNNPTLNLDMFELRKLNSHTGIMNHRSVKQAHNYLFFLGYDGNAYALSSSKVATKILSTNLLTKDFDFRGFPFSLTNVDLADASSFFYRDVWYVSAGAYVFCYHYQHQAWTVFDHLNITSFYQQDNTMIWGNTTGQTCTFSDTEYLDLGVPYHSFWETGNLNFNDPTTYKYFRDVFIVTNMFKGYSSDVRVSFLLDYTDVGNRYSISNQIARWGISKFGDKFITGDVNASLPFQIGRRARTLKIRVSNSYKLLDSLIDKIALDALTNMQDEDMYFVTSENLYYVYDTSSLSWNSFTLSQLNQPMRVYQVNGEFELRGKR